MQELWASADFIHETTAGELIWRRGQMFLSESSQVLDANNLVHRGDLPSGSVFPDASLPRVYLLSGNRVQVVHEFSLVVESSFVIPDIPAQGNSGLLRFGQNGLAFRTGDGKIAFLQSELIGGTSRPRGVLVNDVNPDGVPHEATLVAGVSHGTLVPNPDGTFVYRPAPHFNGSDQFTYRVSTGDRQSNIATVYLAVQAVNDAPVAVNDAYSVSQSGVFKTNRDAGVLKNDADLERDPLTAALVAGPSYGTLSFEDDGSFTYTPALGYAGSDQFTYKTRDGNLFSSVATVFLTIKPRLPGDTNSDGVVNLSDFGVLKSQFGTGTTWAEGDFDGNGRVDLTDFGVLKANFGRAQAALVGLADNRTSAVGRAVASIDTDYAAAIDMALTMLSVLEETSPVSRRQKHFV